MVKTGTKHDQLIINISKYVLYTWLIFSVIISIIIKQKIDVENIWMSIIIYANIFMPVYLAIFSIPFNKKFRYRLLKSIIALAPIIISYQLLYDRVFSLNIDIIYLIVGIMIIFLLNFTLTANKKDYCLILLTLFFMGSSFLLGYIHNNSINNYLLINRNNYDSLLNSGVILIILSGIMFVFINHLIKLLILERKSKCLK